MLLKVANEQKIRKNMSLFLLLSSNKITGNDGSFYQIIISSVLHIQTTFSTESVPKYLSPLFPSRGNKKEWV